MYLTNNLIDFLKSTFDRPFQNLIEFNLKKSTSGID